MSDSRHRLIIEQVQSDIQALALSGISSSNVVILKDTKGNERVEIGIPGIAVMHGEGFEQYDEADSNNIYIAIGYPVHVLIFDTDRPDGRPDQEDEHDERLLWRQKIVQRFVGRNLGTYAFRCTAQSTPVFDPREWRDGRWYSELLLHFWTWIPRGADTYGDPVFFRESASDFQVEDGATLVERIFGYQRGYVLYEEDGETPLTDPDTGEPITLPGHAITWTIIGGDDAALFEFDNVSDDGAAVDLLFLSPCDYENPIDEDGDNFYQITIRQTDGLGATTDTDLTIEVIPASGVFDDRITEAGDTRITEAGTDTRATEG